MKRASITEYTRYIDVPQFNCDMGEIHMKTIHINASVNNKKKIVTQLVHNLLTNNPCRLDELVVFTECPTLVSFYSTFSQFVGEYNYGILRTLVDHQKQEKDKNGYCKNMCVIFDRGSNLGRAGTHELIDEGKNYNMTFIFAVNYVHHNGDLTIYTERPPELPSYSRYMHMSNNSACDQIRRQLINPSTGVVEYNNEIKWIYINEKLTIHTIIKSPIDIINNYKAEVIPPSYDHILNKLNKDTQYNDTPLNLST